MTSSITNLQTTAAAGATPAKGSAVFGTPQLSGDFMAMLMGAFGNIVPAQTTSALSTVEGVTNAPPTFDPLLMTGLAAPGDTEQDLGTGDAPLVDAAMDGSEMVPENDDVFTAMMAQTKKVITGQATSESQAAAAVSNGTAPVDETAVDVLPTSSVAPDGLVDADSSVDDTVFQKVVTGQASADVNPSDDLAARLNAMTVGGGQVVADKSQKPGAQSSKNPVASLLNTGNGLSGDTGYVASFMAGQGDYKSSVTPSATTSQTVVDDMKSQNMTPADDMIDAVDAGPGLDLDMTPDLSSAATRNMSVADTGAGSAQAAGRSAATVAGSHIPATVQAVAAHVQSMAQNRDTRSLTLHLDPPELGRMQVKMSFGRDKSVRADILVEKSDTLKLMEQDSTTLKSALDQAGLQTDAGSLNFSLADQGAFAQSDREAFLAGSSVNDNQPIGGSDVDIAGFEFKTTEEWSVDPSTGITRYNIVV